MRNLDQSVTGAVNIDSGQMISIMRREHSKVTDVVTEYISASKGMSDAHLSAEGGILFKPGTLDSWSVVAHQCSSDRPLLSCVTQRWDFIPPRTQMKRVERDGALSAIYRVGD